MFVWVLLSYAQYERTDKRQKLSFSIKLTYQLFLNSHNSLERRKHKDSRKHRSNNLMKAAAVIRMKLLFPSTPIGQFPLNLIFEPFEEVS